MVLSTLISPVALSFLERNTGSKYPLTVSRGAAAIANNSSLYPPYLYERRLFKVGAPLLSSAPSLLPADCRLAPPDPFPSCTAAAAALAPIPISASPRGVGAEAFKYVYYIQETVPRLRS